MGLDLPILAAEAIDLCFHWHNLCLGAVPTLSQGTSGSTQEVQCAILHSAFRLGCLRPNSLVVVLAIHG